VIGGGPAGLLAAYGARLAECRVAIFTDTVRQRFPGAQVLQQSIPGLTPTFADAYIHIAKWGEEEHYRAKVYGPGSEVASSWGEYGEPVRAWNMTNIYRDLLNIVQDDIIEHLVSPLHDLPDILDSYDAVINTAPVPAFCMKPFEHEYRAAGVKIFAGAQAGVQHNQIVYNGTTRDAWYRSSRLFGEGSTEWPAEAQQGGEYVRKPISTDCDCWLDRPHYYRAGRFGRWEKGILVHNGYEIGVQAAHALHAL
jgi:hypothetical protein